MIELAIIATWGPLVGFPARFPRCLCDRDKRWSRRLSSPLYLMRWMGPQVRHLRVLKSCIAASCFSRASILEGMAYRITLATLILFCFSGVLKPNKKRQSNNKYDFQHLVRENGRASTDVGMFIPHEGVTTETAQRSDIWTGIWRMTLAVRGGTESSVRQQLLKSAHVHVRDLFWEPWVISGVRGHNRFIQLTLRWAAAEAPTL